MGDRIVFSDADKFEKWFDYKQLCKAIRTISYSLIRVTIHFKTTLLIGLIFQCLYPFNHIG